MEYKTKHEENEFTEMVNYLKKQAYQKRKGLTKRFEDINLNQPTALGMMLLYS
jgi:hypothetical protein